MTSRDPDVPSDEPGAAWPPDEATSELVDLDPLVPDDLPDEPIVTEDVREPDLDLDAPDDADDGGWVDEVEADEPDLPVEPAEPLTLSWRETAHLPEHGIDVPAVLDPTVGESTWTVPMCPPLSRLVLLVRIDAFEVRIEVAVREGRVAELRLGRDALGGKVLIRP